MSVQSQIARISDAVSDAFSALTQKGVSVPSGTKVDGLASLISTIKTGKPTKFTNRYDPANVVLKKVSNASSSSGASQTADNYVNYLIIPYHHKANEEVVLRMRGISTVRDRMNLVVFKEDGTTPETWGQISSSAVSYDEYGDAVIDIPSVFLSREWYYMHLNFQYTAVNSGVTVAKTGPIVTINEPIGNGGYVG